MMCAATAAIIGGGAASLVRSIRMNVNAMRNNGYDPSWGYIIQMSRIELIDSDGAYFSWPSDVVCSASSFIDFPSNEGLDKVLDHSVYTKMCGRRLQFPSIFTFDTLSQSIDIQRFNKWQWWAANDSANFLFRNPSSFSLEVSKDNETWVTVDTVTNFNGTIRNYQLAYEGDIAFHQIRGGG